MASEVNVHVRSMRRAAVVAALGLLVQLGGSFYWTPLTFIASAAIGLPLVGIGALLFLRAAFRIMKERGAL
jgi:hypothetical protein